MRGEELDRIRNDPADQGAISGKDRNNQPLVSVVIPTHDRPNLLERAVRSVLDQTYGELELIVVDDASAEPIGLDRIADFDAIKDVRCIRLEENQGGAGARNAGLTAVNGEYVAFLDDDDEWLPEKVERQVHRFEAANDNVGLVFTGVIQRDENRGIEDVHFNPVPGDHLRGILLKHYIGTLSSVMIRSAVFDHVDGFRDDLPCWHDWEFYVRVARKFGFEAVNEPLVRQYVGDHDQLSDDFEAKRRVSQRLLEETFGELPASYGIERAVQGSQYYELAHSAYRTGRRLQALRYLVRAIMLQPFETKYYKYLVLYTGGERIRWWGA